MGYKLLKICTICARGGSKGVPNKNLKLLRGIPLVSHTVRQAVSCGFFDCVAVSSDSNKILEVARETGASLLIKRPEEFALDTSPKIPAIRHCVEEAERILGVKFDLAVDLDATSPLRNVEDIRAVIQLLTDSETLNVITGTPSKKSPYFNMVEMDKSGFVKLCKPMQNTFVRRQDVPNCYDMNASIYGWKRESLFLSESLFGKGTKLYEMPEERSVDIDSEVDFKIVQTLMESKSL